MIRLVDLRVVGWEIGIKVLSWIGWGWDFVGFVFENDVVVWDVYKIFEIDRVYVMID